MTTKLGLALLLLLCSFCFVWAQRSGAKPVRPVIFAVLNDGATLEPIAYLENKKLVSAVDGAEESNVLAAFHKQYFKLRASYPLIFGGVRAGSVTIKSSNPETECERHTARVLSSTTRTKLKGNVMALAASNSIAATGSGVRRPPTPDERAEIETLVRTEFGKKKVSAAVMKKLRYQNLTAIDVDKDGTVEFVGSFWVEPTAKTRTLLFFIAEKKSDGKYTFSVSQVDEIDEESAMGGDISPVDTGVYHELLLDVLDYDADGTSEIFTYSPSFEGGGFNVYRKQGTTWTKVFEAANYRCAF